MSEPVLKFLKTRNVKSPTRAHSTDAGVDFYVPEANSEFIDDFVKKNIGHDYILIGEYLFNDIIMTTTMHVSKNDELENLYSLFDNMLSAVYFDYCLNDKNVTIEDIKVASFKIIVPGHERILVPSGIKTYIEPAASALIATNKSGVATKKGVVVGATTVDSHYSGEVHLSVINTNSYEIEIECNNKLVQFIHTPVLLSMPTEVSINEYNNLTNSVDRGDGGFGSTGLK